MLPLALYTVEDAQDTKRIVLQEAKRDDRKSEVMMPMGNNPSSVRSIDL